MSGEEQYLELLKTVREFGELRETRNSVTRSIFGARMVFNLEDNTIPLLTTKHVSFRNIFYELKWFLSGSTDTYYLKERKIKIWDANSTREFLDARGLTDVPEGFIGPGYGHQFRHSGAPYDPKRDPSEAYGFDQVKDTQNLIRNDPMSRRIVMTLWAPSQTSQIALPSCHGSLIQFYVRKGKYLDCFTHQRSCDLYLGCPYNIASYSLLTHMLAKSCNLKPGILNYSFGDTHLYENSIEAAYIQSTRVPGEFPKIRFKETRDNIWEYEYRDIEIIDYKPCLDPLPSVKMVA